MSDIIDDLERQIGEVESDLYAINDEILMAENHLHDLQQEEAALERELAQLESALAAAEDAAEEAEAA